MPNWCSNVLVPLGEPKDIQAFLDFMFPNKDDNDFSFEKVIPLPPCLAESHHCSFGPIMDVIHSINFVLCGYRSAYDFCCENWGTKWDADQPCFNPTSGTVYFLTAWCPPDGFYQALSEMFPNLSFETKAFEGGCGICQTVVFENGSIVSEDYPDNGSKDWFELMFEVEGGSDDYHFDSNLGTYVPNDPEN